MKAAVVWETGIIQHPLVQQLEELLLQFWSTRLGCYLDACAGNDIVKWYYTRITYLFTYLLTPRSTVLLKKLTGFQPVKKFRSFYGTRRFITAFTSAGHLSLSWASSIRSTPPHPTSWRSILIISSRLRLGLPSGLFPSGFPTKTLYSPLLSLTLATCRANLILLNVITRKILVWGTLVLPPLFIIYQ